MTFTKSACKNRPEWNRTRNQFGGAQLWAWAYNHKAGGNSALVDRVISIRVESFQDAEKDSLRFYIEMGIVPLSGKVLCYNTGLIGRHYLTNILNLL